MLILHVGPRDTGEYTITAENALGRAECSTVLSVRGERETHLRFNLNDRWNKKNQTCLMMLNHLSSTQSEDSKASTT